MALNSGIPMNELQQTGPIDGLSFYVLCSRSFKRMHGLTLIQPCTMPCSIGTNLSRFWTASRVGNILLAYNGHLGTTGSTSSLKIVDNECLCFKCTVHVAV